MASYPIVNGLSHDWSCVEIDINGTIYVGVTELTYSDELAPGEASGTSAQRLARTRGKYKAEGSMTLNLQDAIELQAALGNGFKETAFPITASYSDGTNPIIVDKLWGCRITSTDGGGSQGGDALVRKFGLDVARVSWNGIDPLTNMRK